MLRDQELLIHTARGLARKISEAIEELGGDTIDLLYMATLTNLVVIGTCAVSVDAACGAVKGLRDYLERAEHEEYWAKKDSVVGLH